jgi:hypothetical protein
MHSNLLYTGLVSVSDAPYSYYSHKGMLNIDCYSCSYFLPQHPTTGFSFKKRADVGPRHAVSTVYDPSSYLYHRLHFNTRVERHLPVNMDTKSAAGLAAS